MIGNEPGTGSGGENVPPLSGNRARDRDGAARLAADVDAAVAAAPAWRALSGDKRRDLMFRLAVRGLVDIDDVAAMIVMLASDAGKAFHGSCIAMDSGISAG